MIVVLYDTRSAVDLNRKDWGRSYPDPGGAIASILTSGWYRYTGSA